MYIYVYVVISTYLYIIDVSRSTGFDVNDLPKSFFGQDLPICMASGHGPPRGVSCFSRSLVRYARKHPQQI